jgi:flagellar motor switch protein FliN
MAAKKAAAKKSPVRRRRPAARGAAKADVPDAASHPPAQDTPSEPVSVSLPGDLPLVFSIELGRTQQPLERIAQIGEQSLIELDKTVGDPVDVLLNGRLYARGEVVTVSENFGVRITEIIDQA